MVLDLIIIGIILACVISGYKKGLIEVAFNLLAFVISLILSLILYVPVTNYIIDNTNAYDNIKNTIKISLEKQDITQDDKGQIIINENMPEVITNYINETISNVAENTKDNLAEIVSVAIAQIMIKIVALAGIFIVIRIILGILKIVTNAISKLPVINGVNKIRRNIIWHFRRNINNIHITCCCNGNIYNNK